MPDYKLYSALIYGSEIVQYGFILFDIIFPNAFTCKKDKQNMPISRLAGRIVAYGTYHRKEEGGILGGLLDGRG